MLPQQPVVHSIDTSELPIGDSVLVTQPYLSELESLKMDLLKQVRGFWAQADFEMKQKEMQHKEVMSELEAMCSEKLDETRLCLSRLQEEVMATKLSHEESLSSMKAKQELEIRLLETSFTEKLSLEMNRYSLLQNESSKKKKEWECDYDALIAENSTEIASLEGRLLRLQTEDSQEVDRIKADISLADELQKKTAQHLQSECDMEISSLQKQYETKISELNKDKAAIKGQLGIHRKQHSDLQKRLEDINDKKININQLKVREAQRLKEIQNENDRLQQKLDELTTQLVLGRNNLQEISSNNMEIDKFIFVLNHRIHELQSQVDPKNLLINQMHQHTRTKDSDLEICHAKSRHIQTNINETKKINISLHQELKQLHQQLSRKRLQIKNFNDKLAHVVDTFLLDPQALRKAFNQIAGEIQKLVGHRDAQNSFDEVQIEVDKQLHYRDDSARLVISKLQAKLKEQKDHTKRSVDSNSELLSEIGSFRERIARLMIERQERKVLIDRMNRAKKHT